MRFYLLTPARVAVEPPRVKGAPGEADCACPACGAKAPLLVKGRDMRDAADDRAVEATAVAECCGAAVGTLRAEPETLFGVEEDRAALEGRPRVYALAKGCSSMSANQQAPSTPAPDVQTSNVVPGEWTADRVLEALWSANAPRVEDKCAVAFGGLSPDAADVAYKAFCEAPHLGYRNSYVGNGHHLTREELDAVAVALNKAVAKRATTERPDPPADQVALLRAEAAFWQARQETTRAFFDGKGDELKAALQAERDALRAWLMAGGSDTSATYCFGCQRQCPHATWDEARAAGWETVTGDGPDGMTVTCSDACRGDVFQPENVER